jgi:hypothetical protein
VVESVYSAVRTDRWFKTDCVSSLKVYQTQQPNPRQLYVLIQATHCRKLRDCVQVDRTKPRLLVAAIFRELKVFCSVFSIAVGPKRIITCHICRFVSCTQTKIILPCVRTAPLQPSFLSITSEVQHMLSFINIRKLYLLTVCNIATTNITKNSRSAALCIWNLTRYKYNINNNNDNRSVSQSVCLYNKPTKVSDLSLLYTVCIK